VPAVLGQLVDAPEAEGKSFLSKQALDSDDFTPISHVSVGKVHHYGDMAQVAVTYVVDEEPVTGSLSLVAGEKRFGLFRTWEVSESLPTVEVDSDSELKGRFAAADLEPGSYPALPGAYVVRAAGHPLLTAAPSRFVLRLGESNGPALDARVKPEAMEAARKAIEDRIAECAASTSLPLQSCPFLTYWSQYSGEITDVAIHITTPAQFSLEYDSYTGFLDIVPEAYGELRVTGTVKDTDWFGEPTVEPYEDDVTFSVSGSVAGSADQLSLQFDD
jgi:hypothetical protein